MPKNILFVVEGKKMEPKLIDKIFGLYHLDLQYNKYIYNTNIYDLYTKLYNQDHDFENLNLLDILRSRSNSEQEKSDVIEMLSNKFTDIILIFDYDPQDDLFSSEKLIKLTEYFSESTNNGKLYINYPMCESYKHFKSIPDQEFLDRTFPLIELKNHHYKQTVNQESCITDINKISREQFNAIIHQIIQKCNVIDNSDDIRNVESIDFLKILVLQGRMLEKCKSVYVLCTCLLLIPLYNSNLIQSSN